MENKNRDVENIILIVGIIITGAVLINTLTLNYYGINNTTVASIIVLISLFSFSSFWRAVRDSDGRGIGCSFMVYIIIHLVLLIFNFLLKVIVTTPFHWGYG